jgi:hypothetical protein
MFFIRMTKHCVNIPDKFSLCAQNHTPRVEFSEAATVQQKYQYPQNLMHQAPHAGMTSRDGHWRLPWKICAAGGTPDWLCQHRDETTIMKVCAAVHGDNGQTDRKLAVDYYGPMVPIGGGALSGKDLAHIDRAAA